MKFVKASARSVAEIHAEPAVSAKPLTNCPACKKPVRKVFSAFTTPHKLKPLSVTDAKKAGFQGL